MISSETIELDEKQKSRRVPSLTQPKVASLTATSCLEGRGSVTTFRTLDSDRTLRQQDISAGDSPSNKGFGAKWRGPDCRWSQPGSNR